jgi:hypothetical protein
MEKFNGLSGLDPRDLVRTAKFLWGRSGGGYFQRKRTGFQ